MRRPILEAALEAVHRGWAVFPLRGRSKEPITAHGVVDAVHDPDQVDAWWSHSPGANYGVALGPVSNLWVLDVDTKPPRDGAASLAALVAEFGPLPATFTVRTGSGGWHYYWKLPQHRAFHNRKDFRPGLEARGHHQYVVGPGCTHPNGKRYEIESEAPVADAPKWLLDLLEVQRPVVGRPRGRRPEFGIDDDAKRRAVEGAMVRMRGQGIGGRNDTLRDCAFYLGGVGLSHAEVRNLLWDVAAQWIGLPPEDPFTTKEFEKTVALAVRDGARSPIAPPRKPASKNEPAPKGGSGSPPPPRPPPEPSTPKKRDDSWKDRLAVTEKGAIKASVANLDLVFLNDPQLDRGLAFDLLAQDVRLDVAPVWCDHDPIKRDYPCYLHPVDDIDRALVWVQDRYGISISNKKHVFDAIVLGARARRQVHPVRDYLDALKWDGVSRVDDWLVDLFDAPNTVFVRTVARKWLIAAVARAYRPGCKVDDMLVLEGVQGIGKSTALRALFSAEFFKSSSLHVDDKFAPVELQGVWGFEVAEFDIGRAEARRIKGFVSRETDNFRPPHATKSIKQPRSVIFAITVNDGQYLADQTGNRRYWCVRCRSAASIDRVERLRDQLWAEATHHFRAGEHWWLEGELVALQREEAAARRTSDPWEEALSGWAEMRQSCTTHEALRQLGFEHHQMKRADEMRMAEVLHQLGFTEHTKVYRGDRRVWGYERPEAEK